MRAIRRVPGTTTGSAFVTYRADGGRDFVYNIANSASAAPGRRPARARAVRGLPVLPRHGLLAVQRRHLRRRPARRRAGRAAGAQISFDPNIRKELLALPEVAETIAAVLAVTDLLLPSDADLAHLCPGQSADDAARACWPPGVAWCC